MLRTKVETFRNIWDFFLLFCYYLLTSLKQEKSEKYAHTTALIFDNQVSQTKIQFAITKETLFVHVRKGIFYHFRGQKKTSRL